MLGEEDVYLKCKKEYFTRMKIFVQLVYFNR